MLKIMNSDIDLKMKIS